MKEIEDGGQAFPRELVEGMTLRDYFAGQVIQGLVVGAPGFIGNAQAMENYSPYARKGCNSALAERAYVLADAMIKAKENLCQKG